MAFPVTCRVDKIGHGAGRGQDRVKPLFEADEIREAVEQLGDDEAAAIEAIPLDEIAELMEQAQSQLPAEEAPEG